MENTLNIQITLNDEQLKNLIVGNINDLPKEKLQDIILQAIKEIMVSSEGQKMFIEKSSYYGSSNQPSSYLYNLVERADIKDTISPIVNKAVAEFAANYPEILERCLKNSITEMFMDQFQRSQLQQAWDMVMNRGELIMGTSFKIKRDNYLHLESLTYGVGDCMTPDTINIGYEWPDTKSRLKIGNLIIHNTHHFNWFQRKMWKLLLGFEIENVAEN